MDKIKCRIHAEELKNVLRHENTPQRRSQIVRVMDATREHKDVWEEVFSDEPAILTEMNNMLGQVSKPRMLID